MWFRKPSFPSSSRRKACAIQTVFPPGSIGLPSTIADRAGAESHPNFRWTTRCRAAKDGEGELTLSMTAGRDQRDALETRDLIRKALMGLSEEHRSAIILKEYLGLNLEEVARVMDCPLSTAKSRLYHGLRGVQRNLVRIGIRS